jgi:hypothetical protein
MSKPEALSSSYSKGVVMTDVDAVPRVSVKEVALVETRDKIA